MALRSNLISDLAKVANGAASAFGGIREEIDNIIRQRLERTLNARGLVTREEFDALRTRHEALVARLAMLESAVENAATKSDSAVATSKATRRAAKPTKKPAK